MRIPLLLSLVFLLPAAQAEPSGPPACSVAALLGKAERLPPEGSPQPLAVGSAVAVGELLQTAPEARLRLRCGDGSSLVMAGGSRLRIEVFESSAGQRREARFQLLQGLIGQKVSPGGGWQVRTPSAVTAVRGTEFLVELKTDGSTGVLTRSGSIDLQALQPGTRGLMPLPPLVAVAALLGSDCAAGRCGPAVAWSAERVQALTDRLSGV